uniref:RNase H type-1 domain-containing protein n=1 Tax=Chenopodium quinoa TaxID=63459 RepID=A0A803MZ54_CHEQI
MKDVVVDVVATTCLNIQGMFDVDIVEAMAMRHALTIAMQAGFAIVATRGVVREFLLLGSVFGKRCSSRDLVRWRADGCRVVRWDSVGYVLCCGVAQGPEKWDTKVAEANEILWGLKLALDEGIDKLVVETGK